MPGSDDVKATSRVKLTYEDFLLFPDDGKRHELIDGDHYVTPCPNTKHQVVSENLYFMMRPTELSRDAGDVLTSALLPGLEMPLARIFAE
jgi:hypothetical protein